MSNSGAGKGKVKDATATSSSHQRDTMGRTRGGNKELQLDIGATTAGPSAAEIPVQGDSRGGGDTVSDSVESGFDDGLINFTVNGTPETGEAFSFDELHQRYQMLANLAQRQAEIQKNVDVTSATPPLSSHLNPMASVSNAGRNVDVASATPSFSSLVNPVSSIVEEGSKTPTENHVPAMMTASSVVENNSISQPFQQNREFGRIFISFGRSIAVYDEDLKDIT
ncbi:hypothetical protein B0H16DRAFT_1467256 [Mycena metata]|uniref:Uncharacterized protein n=1 Tax=Mycena metata TaxID=1033252 RepID=A0AAD7MWE4_9AGAR|nr:hypothetical protein B0H16DRAFT_1467256 [Mycena metata]